MIQLALDILVEAPLEIPVESILHETVLAVLSQEQVEGGASLTILLTDDEQMRLLNRDYAGLDEPTDVLSFAMSEGGNGARADLLLEEMDGYLGDIAISVMKAERQAEKGGHSLTAELQLLTVHGVLHLLGYDHYDPAEKAAMWAAQKAALKSLDVEVKVPA